MQFVNKIIAARPSLASSLEISPLQVTDSSEVVLTTDNVLNFCQLAVLACQRANAEKNKIMRESWVRLCGTYQSRGGVLASKEVRSVSLHVTARCMLTQLMRVDWSRHSLKLQRCTLPSRNQRHSPTTRWVRCCLRCWEGGLVVCLNDGC